MQNKETPSANVGTDAETAVALWKEAGRCAAIHLDHHRAEVIRLGAGSTPVKIDAHVHPTRQHGSEVRSEHEFFGDVCDAVADASSVLVLGSHTAQADFRHYVDKHRPALLRQIVGWKTVDRPTDGQLQALVREHFAARADP